VNSIGTAISTPFCGFRAVSKRLQTPEDYGLIARRLLERLAAQNVRYAEIIVSAGVVLWKKQDFAPLFDAISAAAAGSVVEVRWILDAVRQFGVEPPWRWRTGGGASGPAGGWFRDWRQRRAGPAEWFTEVFSFAKSRDCTLRRTQARAWGRNRFGRRWFGCGTDWAWHRRGADEKLMAHLREHDIPLEICITSNLVTGVVARLEDHPVRQLFDAGVPITLNTDDPAMFGCTLTGSISWRQGNLGSTKRKCGRLWRMDGGIGLGRHNKVSSGDIHESDYCFACRLRPRCDPL